MNYHTPGPWESQLSEQYPYDYAILAAGSEVTSVDDLWDAYLIAAAPAMLEALEAMVQAQPCDCVVKGAGCPTCEALEAIAAARGAEVHP